MIVIYVATPLAPNALCYRCTPEGASAVSHKTCAPEYGPSASVWLVPGTE